MRLFQILKLVVIGGVIALVIHFHDTESNSVPECEAGYMIIENGCVDMCEGINCGIGGSCFGGNCTCQTGYANVKNFCEETCFEENRELIKTLFGILIDI